MATDTNQGGLQPRSSRDRELESRISSEYLPGSESADARPPVAERPPRGYVSSLM